VDRTSDDSNEEDWSRGNGLAGELEEGIFSLIVLEGATENVVGEEDVPSAAADASCGAGCTPCHPSALGVVADSSLVSDPWGTMRVLFDAMAKSLSTGPPDGTPVTNGACITQAPQSRSSSTTASGGHLRESMAMEGGKVGRLAVVVVSDEDKQ
jgi:hypothetical protein